MSKFITKRAGEDYDWQSEVIARIEAAGGDLQDEETWRATCADVWKDEEMDTDADGFDLVASTD